MSLFGGSTAGGGAASSGSSLFPSLNLNTGSDPMAKRKSIFEPPATQASSQPSMFGSTPATSAPSLFGNTSTATGATTASPFSFSKPAATTPAPSGGLFGTTTTSQPSGGLFGALGASTTTQPSTGGGLFGGLGTSNTSAQPSAGAGLFGSTTTNNQPVAQTSFFGNAGGNAPTNNSGGVPQQQSDNTAQNQHRESAYFSSLLERQKKKARFSTTEQNGRLAQLPSVNMDLGDLARRAQELGARTNKVAASSVDSRAHYLLAGSGVAPGKAYKDFQALDGDLSGLEKLPRPSLVDDRDAYLKGLQTKGREAMMKESMQRVYREVDAYIEQSLGIDFEEQKVRIMEHFGLLARDESASGHDKSAFGKSRSIKKSDSTTRSVFGRSAAEKSLIGVPGTGLGTTSLFGGDSAAASTGQTNLIKNQTMRDLRDKERLFVEQIQQLNQDRMAGKSFPVMQNFESVERVANGDSPKQLADAYLALREITRESDSNAKIKERQYASDYLGEPENPAGNISLRRLKLEKSRTYLEKAFYRELEAVIDKNPREAQLGGRPTVIHKVRAYIRVRAARHDLAPDGAELQQIGDNGDYCWIMIFYLLRAGFVKEAAEYVNEDPAFQSTDRRFVSYLTSYANSSDRRLSRKLQEMIDGEYNQRAKIAPKGTVDPYRLACYKVIGRCDLSVRDLGAIGQGVEDWTWLQFTLAREVDRLEELSGDVFGLEQICETVTEIGQKHFQKNQVEGSSAYGTYFLMQILAGLFEQAVDYLHGFNPVSAVHFAIALDFYGLLRVSDYSTAGNELCKFHERGTTSVANLHSVIFHITAASTQFRTSNSLLHSFLPNGLANSRCGLSHTHLPQLRLTTHCSWPSTD